MAPHIRSIGNSTIALDNSESSPLKEKHFSRETNPQIYYKSLVKLFIAPALAILLSVIFTSRYATLIIVYFLTTVKPVCYLLMNGRLPFVFRDRNETFEGFNKLIFEKYIDSTLRLQKSMGVQFAVLASFIWIYHRTTEHCGGDKNVHQAFSNAYSIIRLEHFLHVDVEPDWQIAFRPHKYTMAFLSRWYASSHFVIPSLTAGWLMYTGKDSTYQHRGSFAFALCLALLGYWFVPTMPPRLLRRYANTYPGDFHNDENMSTRWLEMIDSLREEHSAYDKLHSAMGNPYAAMPSMHTGWAWWSCLSIWDGLRCTSTKLSARVKNIWRALSVCHCLVIMLATIVTANHYVLDLAAGLTCVILGRRLAKFVFCGRGLSLLFGKSKKDDLKSLPR